MLAPDQSRRLADIAAAGGLGLSDDHLAALGAPLASATQQEAGIANEVKTVLGRGFLHLAATGYEFGPTQQIQEHFGKTLRGNYPEASESFLRFATTYWTFKLWLSDNLAGDVDELPLGISLLTTLEQQFAALFFPTPGPAKVDPDEREKAQRATLAQHEVPIDVDDFMQGNPILIRDRKASGSGCASSVVFLGVAGVAALLLLP